MTRRWMIGLILLLALALSIGCEQNATKPQREEPAKQEEPTPEKPVEEAGAFSSLLQLMTQVFREEDVAHNMSRKNITAYTFAVEPMGTVGIYSNLKFEVQPESEATEENGKTMVMSMEVEFFTEGEALEEEEFLQRLSPVMGIYAKEIGEDEGKLMEAVKLIRETKRNGDNPEFYHHYHQREAPLSKDLKDCIQDMSFSGHELQCSRHHNELQEAADIQGVGEQFSWSKTMAVKEREAPEDAFFQSMDAMVKGYDELGRGEMLGPGIDLMLNFGQGPHNDRLSAYRTLEKPLKPQGEEVYLYQFNGGIFVDGDWDEDTIVQCLDTLCLSMPKEFRHLSQAMYDQGIVPYRGMTGGDLLRYHRIVLDESKAWLDVSYEPALDTFSCHFVCGLNSDGDVVDFDLDQYRSYYKLTTRVTEEELNRL